MEPCPVDNTAWIVFGILSWRTSLGQGRCLPVALGLYGMQKKGAQIVNSFLHLKSILNVVITTITVVQLVTRCFIQIIIQPRNLGPSRLKGSFILQRIENADPVCSLPIASLHSIVHGVPREVEPPAYPYQTIRSASIRKLLLGLQLRPLNLDHRPLLRKTRASR